MKKLILIFLLFSFSIVTKTFGQATSMLDLTGLKSSGITQLKFGSGIKLLATTKNSLITKFTATDSLGRSLPVVVKAAPKSGGGSTATCEVCVTITVTTGTTTSTVNKCVKYDCTKSVLTSTK